MFGLVGSVGMGLGSIIKDLGLVKPSMAEKRKRLVAEQVLADAFNNNARLEVEVPDSPTSFSTGVAGIATEQGLFYCDPLVPKTGNSRITPKKSVVSFIVNIGGTQHTFKSLYLGATKHNKFDALIFAIPPKVNTVQRRLDFRVTPKYVEPVELVIKLDPIATDVAIDISAGGISFRHTAEFKEGLVIPTTLRLPKEEGDITLSIEVIASRQIKTTMKKKDAPDNFAVRARFEDVRSTADKKIRDYIARRQREIINPNS